MIRTHTAGSLRADHAGQQVTLAGWVARRRDHGGVIFIDLRDASGYVQVVFREEQAHHLRAEYCIKVEGTVTPRPAGNENPDLPTGEIEVTASGLTVLSEAAPLPFPVDGAGGGAAGNTAGEDVRFKYRYLDLRRAEPGNALRLRSEAGRIARRVLDEAEFVEVETPYLTRSTPEGARDFLVPVRLQPGSWYALPQSPQLFKQLLMVAGLERYYQLARCFRDEDSRADRQPEFTQLDVEMSFVEQDDVIELAEAVTGALWLELAGYDLPRPLPRLTFAEAMDRFGTDKPDLRFGVELVELTGYFAATPFRIFQAPYVGAVVMPGGADQPRRAFDGWQDWARSRGARGLAYVTFAADGPAGGTVGGPVAKNLSESERAGLAAAVGAAPGDAAFFAAGQRAASQALLGAVREEIGRRCDLVDPDEWAFCWVVDAPMFEREEEGGGWTAVHHPFTAPAPGWADRFQDHPDQALARAYDLVCNGNEIGGGSIRIHTAEMQQRVFEVIGLTKAEAEGKFGFLLEAFKYGPPPHGGIAFGWDRICALLHGTDSIREVIAFPKTGAGFDPLTGAPTPVTAQQRREAGVDAAPRATHGEDPGTPQGAVRHT